MELNLASVVESLGGALHGDAATRITGIAPLEAATAGDLSFLSNPKYQQQFLGSKAACVIVGPAMKDIAMARGSCIVAEQPYLYFAKLTQWWKRMHGNAAVAGVHPSAVVDADAQVHPSASIGAHVLVPVRSSNRALPWASIVWWVSAALCTLA